MGRKKKDETIINQDVVMDQELTDEELLDSVDTTSAILALQKITKKGIEKMDVSLPETPNEARFLIDQYYQIQKMRIVSANQIRAMAQEADNKSASSKNNEQKLTTSLLLFKQFETMEENAKNLLDAYVQSNKLSLWASKTMGIGPVLAASLPAYLSIIKEADGSTKMHAGSWWNYCGLNDNNIPWLSREKSRKIVEDAMKNNGGELNEQAMAEICGKSHWKIEHFENFKGCYNAKTKKFSKDKVISACSIIPYNKELKVVCYKIGSSFHKLCRNDGSLYGRLFSERLSYELQKNENGDYADQAAKILQEKNFSDGPTKDVYLSGKLPIGHIYARCERYVTKLFISHAFEAAYYYEYGEMPPKPYALSFCGHQDYIGPEVPYDSI